MALKGDNLQVRVAIQQGTHQTGARFVATKDENRGWVQDGLKHATNLRHGVESLSCPRCERATLSQWLHIVELGGGKSNEFEKDLKKIGEPGSQN